jgi:hypothetical protein
MHETDDKNIRQRHSNLAALFENAIAEYDILLEVIQQSQH